MTPELEGIKTEIETALDSALESLEVSREDVRRETETIRLAMHEAIVRHAAGQPGQLEHLRRLAKEIPSVLAIPTLEIQADAKARVFRVIASVLDGLFAVAARALAPVLLLGLLVLPGCAWLLSHSTVPSPLVVGVVENVCDVVDDCVATGRLQVDAPACEDTPGTFYAEAHAKTISGELVGSGAAEVCGMIETCLTAWPEAAANQVADYRRWCGRLQGIAQAALTK